MPKTERKCFVVQRTASNCAAKFRSYGSDNSAEGRPSSARYAAIARSIVPDQSAGSGGEEVDRKGPVGALTNLRGEILDLHQAGIGRTG